MDYEMRIAFIVGLQKNAAKTRVTGLALSDDC